MWPCRMHKENLHPKCSTIAGIFFFFFFECRHLLKGRNIAALFRGQVVHFMCLADTMVSAKKLYKLLHIPVSLT